MSKTSEEFSEVLFISTLIKAGNGLIKNIKEVCRNDEILFWREVLL
jgi:hypothetical protein